MVVPGGAQAAEPLTTATAEFDLYGGSETLWLHQYRLGEGSLRLLSFAFREAGGGPQEGLFRSPRGLPAVQGEVTRATALADSLHVFFQDGTHRRYHALGVDVERRLPKGGLPLAIAGDQAGGVVYALVPTLIAEAVSAPAAAAPDQEQEGPRPEATPPAPDGPVVPGDPTAPYSVLRFERGAWHWDRMAPVELTSPAPCRLAASDGRLYVLVPGREAGAGPRLYRSEGDGWNGPLELPGLDGRELLGAGVLNGRFVLVVGPADSGGPADPGLLWVGDEGPEAGPALQAGRDATAAVVFAGGLALAFRRPDNEIEVGLWSAEGRPAGPRQVVEALIPRPEPWITANLPYISYGALTLILVGVFVRRRDRLILPAELMAGQILATYPRRMLAFVLDVVIVLPVITLVMAPAIVPDAPGQDLGRSQDWAAGRMNPDELLRWLVAALAFVAYGTVFEVAMGATPGKRFCQCRVVDERGRRCGLGPILMRNLIRVVEFFPAFQLMPAVVLVLLTRNRQRLGDLLAGTVVIEQVSAAPAADGNDSDDRPSP